MNSATKLMAATENIKSNGSVAGLVGMNQYRLYWLVWIDLRCGSLLLLLIFFFFDVDGFRFPELLSLGNYLEFWCASTAEAGSKDLHWRIDR
jgi:hypothetical protein